IDPLPAEVRNGMVAMGSVGLLSTISTLSLLVFITYRMIYWRRYYEHSIATNQIFILIYNLLLADFQQALSFLFAFYWIAQNKLVGPSNVCFAQGWLIQIGDLSSGLWVLAIAGHTFVGLVLQKQIPFPAFIAGVVTLWIFCLVLTAIGPIMHQKDFFVPAGVWCWIGENHERDRLTLHYLWIFVSQLGSLVTYLAIFFFLRIKLASSAISHHQPSSHASNAHDPFLASRQKILRTARYMVVYPFAYVALTLPLAAGRVSAMARKTPPMVFYCVAGTLMASCGVIDVALYIYTRKALV
ncbi:G protein-coupled glucose receptor regulating Gpa2-domain-containing protein, partial [Tricladium varicosporioides]